MHEHQLAQLNIARMVARIDDPRMFDDPEAATAGGLRDLARWTGGELFTMSAPAQTSLAARQIVSELRHQYLLAFEASSKPGWYPLEVRTTRKNVSVRARSGYFAAGAQPAFPAAWSTRELPSRQPSGMTSDPAGDTRP